MDQTTQPSARGKPPLGRASSDCSTPTDAYGAAGKGAQCCLGALPNPLGRGSAQALGNIGVGKVLLPALVLGTFSVGKGHGTAASSTDPEGLFRWKACCLNYIRGSPVS